MHLRGLNQLQSCFSCMCGSQRARKAAAQMKRPCEVVLLRHGETSWNREGRLQGQQEPGPPLTDLGVQQAQLVSHALVCSTRQSFPGGLVMSRALSTCIHSCHWSCV